MKRIAAASLLLLAGCAVAPKAASPATEPQEAAAGAPAQAAPSTAAPPAPTEAPADVTKSATAPGASAASADSSSELDRAQRELDVAGGDCQNACRALGSMDRAAGRLCKLAQASDPCGAAKDKVVKARDKVKRTCGSCPDVTVDRNAAIPSRP
jgi:hypothetical protein